LRETKLDLVTLWKPTCQREEKSTEEDLAAFTKMARLVCKKEKTLSNEEGKEASIKKNNSVCSKRGMV